MGFVNIVGSYDVSPLYTLVMMNSIFTLQSFVLSDWIFRDENTWYMSCNMNTWGDNEVSYWFTWYVLWHSTRGFPRWYWGNLCIGVDARFSPTETLGSLYSSLCWLSIMNMNVLWCYSSMTSRIDRTETIALCYFSMNSWIDRPEIIALRWLRTLQTIPTFCSPLIGTREWLCIVLWGIIIWPNYVSIVERLH